MKRKYWLYGSFVVLSAIIALALSRLPPNWLKPDYLVNLSSILTLVSFTVYSILALRTLAICAQLTFIPYCLMQSPPLWTPAIWNMLFLTVNVVNVIRLLLEKRQVKLSPDEEKLYNLAFKSLDPREFLKLLTLGEWREKEAGETLVSSGQPNTSVSILCRGEAVAVSEGKELVKIPEGKLIGVPSILSGDPMPVDIKLNTRSRYFCWPTEPLRNFLDKQPELRAKFRLIVGHDLAQSVRAFQDLYLKEWRNARETPKKE